MHAAARHFDPTTGFTDMQWYMYRQQNVAFFAAFSATAFSGNDLLDIARALLDHAPQLHQALLGASAPLSDAMLARLIHRQEVTSLDGFPECWLDDGGSVFAEPDLPLFRIRFAALTGDADRQHRRGFLVVRVAHSLVEGADSALLTRSQSAEHPAPLAAAPSSARVKFAASAFGAAAASLHLFIGNLVTLRPGPFRFETRAFPRKLFSSRARAMGVRQRALFFALVMHCIFDAGTPSGKRRISSTYSTIDSGGGADRDPFMRMRMLFSMFENASDFDGFVRLLDAQLLASEAKESGFNAEMNAAGVRFHRVWSRRIPFAYPPKLFQFMPYDIIIGLIPPHRLTGKLTEGLMEPVYCGAATPGANACVIVPGRELVSFNFYLQQRLLPKISALDRWAGADPVRLHSHLPA